MTKKIRVADLPEFDIAEHLDSEQAMAEYLTVVLEENDPAALAGALGSIARARGMSEIAKASGITREALYRALRPDAQPRFQPRLHSAGRKTGGAGCSCLTFRVISKASPFPSGITVERDARKSGARPSP